MGEFRRVVVTGGAGFIGTNYVRHVLTVHPEWKVVVLDKLTYAGSLENLRGLSGGLEFVQGDIADPAICERVMRGADAVLNFAAESHVDKSLLDPEPFVHTNIKGVLVLLEAARKAGVRRFLQVSTDEIYGDVSGTTRLSLEPDAPAPRSPYAATKAGAEHLVFSYGISFGLGVLVTRGSNTYGPYQYPEKIIPLFITNALEGRPLPLYGDGSAVRDYLHVEDHVRGIDLVLHRGQPGQAYNLGAHQQVSGLEVAKRVLAALDKPLELLSYVPDRPGHDYRYAVDPAKAHALGWRLQHDFAEGLENTVEWYRENQDWWQRIKAAADFRQYQQSWYQQRA